MRIDKAIELYITFKLRRLGPPSASGYQLERLRDQLPAGNSSFHAFELYDHLIYVFERRCRDEQACRLGVCNHLTNDEYRAIFRSQQPRDHIPFEHEGQTIVCEGHKLVDGGGNELLHDKYGRPTCGCGACYFVQREVRSGDYVRISRVGEQDIQETANGEFYAGPGPVGWDVVEGRRPTFPNQEELSFMLGLSIKRVRAALRSGRQKIAEGVINVDKQSFSLTSAG